LYVKTIWVDDETPLSAEKMNKIEQGISSISRVVTGTYIGNGNSWGQDISIGFAPKFVIVASDYYSAGSGFSIGAIIGSSEGGINLMKDGVSTYIVTTALTLSGFSTGESGDGVNISGLTYNWFAIE